MSEWTTEKPTVPGWYWYKGNWNAETVHVVYAQNGRLYARWWDWVDEMNGQWAGPLEVPK